MTTKAPARRAGDGQTCRWPHRTRGADDQRHVAVGGRMLGGPQRRRRQRLAEPHDTGPQQVAAVARSAADGQAAQWPGSQAGWRVHGSSQWSAMMSPCSRMVSRLPARWCRSSTFWLTSVSTPGRRRAKSPSADVTRVGLRTAHALAPLGVPGPHARRIGTKAFLAGQLRRVEARPQAGERVAERRDAAFGAHAGTGEYEQRLRRLDARAHVGHRLFTHHAAVSPRTGTRRRRPTRSGSRPRRASECAPRRHNSRA